MENRSMIEEHDSFLFEPYPPERQLMVDGGRMGRQKHTVHGLVEFDITKARETLRKHNLASGETLSFSAFFLDCLGRAVDTDRHIHAYRDWRNRLILFDELDVNMLFEVEIDGKKMIRPYILRGVNRMSTREIQTEIDAFKNGHAESGETKFINWFIRLPGFLRRLFFSVLFKNPILIKQYYGTVIVSSISMFGSGSGWAIPVPNHTLQITLGGVGEKPGVINHRVEPRIMMSVTVSFDHDIVDGAPMARFIQRLKKLVEMGYVDGE